MTPKEEKIKEAYGEYWEDYKNFVNENGWLTELNDSIHHSVNGNSHHLKILNNKSNICFKEKNNFLRPKSLQGIEDNNGWIKIESEQDFPKETRCTQYHVFKFSNQYKNIINNFSNSEVIYLWYQGEITHYQPIQKPQQPIY